MSLNDFVILQKLGSGSFASVFKARRLIDQQIYALKKIDMKALGPKQKNNALNEIRLLACLSSPYIIGYCESFFDEKLDLLTIAMEYANERDLFKKIQKQKNQRSLMPEVEVWKIFIHLLYGINQLHSKNILHRDLKAENIFIANGIYKIGDMNVSKIIKNGLACTQTGTPYYASPQVWKDQPYNDKSDIWSLGCILYEVAALRPPYEASSMEKLFDMVTRAPTPKIPANYSRELQLIIDSCLQKNPCNRPCTKQLLSNQTLKIYENLLIDFKPQIPTEMKEPLLKTIYMPSSKRQLKNQLPQSNYKSDQRKSISKEEEQTKQQKILTPVNKQIKEKSILTNINNLIKPNESQKKQESQRNRSRIKSCQIFKDASCKKISSKQSLMARADFIIESQRKVSREKDNLNGPHSAIVPKILQKKTSKKNIDSIPKPPDSQNSRQQSQKCLNKQIYIEDEEIIVPKRLIFDETVQEKKSQLKPVIMDLKSTSANKVEELAAKTVNKQEIQTKEPHVEQPINKEENPTKQAYLDQSLHNISLISEKNHQHYKFETHIKPTLQFQILASSQHSHKTEKTDRSQPSANPIQSQTVQLKPVNILIDVNENPQVIKETKQTSPRSTMSYLLGIQKIKNLTQNVSFKSVLFAFGFIKNQHLRLKMIAKQSQFQLKLYHQSHKAIKQSLEPSIKLSSQTTPSKTFQKRSRSKSIRKTQKFKPIVSQSNTNSNVTLIEKINQKMSIEVNAKKNNSKQKSVKKQKTNKKIFDKQNKPFEVHTETNNYQQRLRQMALIPKTLEPSNSQALLRQKQKPRTNQAMTQHKPRHQILGDIQLGNMIVPHRTEKKLSYQEINLFEQKKKKIFQSSSSNPVHGLNNHLDKINLDKKIKKYINI